MDKTPPFAAVILAGSAILLLGGCVPEPVPAVVPYAEAISPDGAVRASVFENTSDAGALTQVLLGFPNGCGSGSVVAYRVGLHLELRWMDDDNLEVIHPPGVEFTRNASGDVIQCNDRKVHVHLSPKSH